MINSGTIIAVDVPGSGSLSDGEGMYLNGTTVAGDVVGVLLKPSCSSVLPIKI